MKSKCFWSHLIVEDRGNQLGEGGSRRGVAEGWGEEKRGGAVVHHLPDQAETGPSDPRHNGAEVAAAKHR